MKVVKARDGSALYFSRSAIPHGGAEPDSHVKPLHHLGLYAFTRDTVLTVAALPPSPLEQQERLEQLRALENGISIQVCEIDRPLVEVNTPEDLEVARRSIRDGEIVA